MSPGGRSEGYVTENDGRFIFEHLPAGKYNLLAEGHGYYRQAFRENDTYSTAIVVGPGLDSAHVVFPLVASGSISGTVTDDDGDPVEGAQIMLFYRGIVSGRFETRISYSTQARSRGTFHFSNLRPGTYFAAVQARPWYVTDNSNNPELDVAYPITFYAGTTDGAAASPITVTSGSEAQLDFALHAVPAVHTYISGHYQEPGTGVTVTLNERGPGGNPLQVFPAMEMQPDKLVLRGIAPGRYDVELVRSDPQGQSVINSKVEDVTGDSAIDFSGAPKLSISGSVVFEGEERPPGPTSLYLGSIDHNFGVRATVEKDGTFALNEMPLAGRSVQILLQNAPGFYVKSVSVKGAKFSRGELELPDSGSVQLSVVAGKGFSAVPGIVLKDGKPVVAAMVLALPANPDQPGLIARDQTDSDGTFTLYSVASGRYTMVAIDDGRDLEYTNPSVMQPYLKAGRVIDVPVGNGSKLQIEVQPRKR